MKFKLSAKHQLAVKGLFECKALESNIRRIQVKGIVKEVEDHLKTYSSAGMDMSWSAVSISSPDKFACKLDSLIKFTCSRVLDKCYTPYRHYISLLSPVKKYPRIPIEEELRLNVYVTWWTS
ncbi:hypothetical protein Tco_0595260 [Tanacetum coccineum]